MPTTKASKRKPVGLRRIAEELNVSVSLVSKVLSGRLGTSGAHADKIRAIHAKARELDYRKNHLAEALRTGRQNVLAVCVHRHGVEGSGIVRLEMHPTAHFRGHDDAVSFLEKSDAFAELFDYSHILMACEV